MSFTSGEWARHAQHTLKEREETSKLIKKLTEKLGIVTTKQKHIGRAGGVGEAAL
jgi:hypothetical protein